jgi:hypothetical protein
MTITFPGNTVDIIDDIRSAIGRPVEFITVISADACGTCYLDSITNTSTDAFCPECGGRYWKPIYETVTLSGHVTWHPADIDSFQTGGMVYDGDCTVQIKLEDGTMAMLDSTIEVHIDNKIMEIKKTLLRGVRPLNRVIISLIEKEKEE